MANIAALEAPSPPQASSALSQRKKPGFTSSAKFDPAPNTEPTDKNLKSNTTKAKDRNGSTLMLAQRSGMITKRHADASRNPPQQNHADAKDEPGQARASKPKLTERSRSTDADEANLSKSEKNEDTATSKADEDQTKDPDRLPADPLTNVAKPKSSEGSNLKSETTSDQSPHNFVPHESGKPLTTPDDTMAENAALHAASVPELVTGQKPRSPMSASRQSAARNTRENFSSIPADIQSTAAKSNDSAHETHDGQSLHHDASTATTTSSELRDQNLQEEGHAVAQHNQSSAHSLFKIEATNALNGSLAQPSLSSSSAHTPHPTSQHTSSAPQTPVTPYSALPIEIGLRALDGTKEISIDLSPRELGELNVTILVSSDAPIHVSFVAEHQHTVMLLQQDAPQIRHALEQAGFSTQYSSLNFSLRQDTSSNSSQSGTKKFASRRNGNAHENAEDLTITDLPRGKIYLNQLDLSV